MGAARGNEKDMTQKERRNNMAENTVYYISEAAKKVQVEAHVLRYWEDELQLPIRRNEMGHRCYSREDIERLQQIKRLKEQGLQLKAIRTVLCGGGGILSGGEETAFEGRKDMTQEKGMLYQAKQDDLYNGGEGTLAMQETVVFGSESEAVNDQAAAERIQISNQDKGKDKYRESANDAGNTEEAGNAENVGNMEHKVNDMVMKKAQKYMVTLSKGKEPIIETPRENLTEYAAQEDMDKTQKAARLQYLLQHMVTEAVKSANQEMCTEIKESILKELDYQFRQQEERDEEHWKKEEEHYRKIDEMIRQRHLSREKLPKGKRKSPISL